MILLNGGNLGKLVTSAATKKSFSFAGLLSGASKTLNFVNQAIPVYYQTKPIFKNAKTLLKVFKKTTEPLKNDFDKVKLERDQSRLNQKVSENKEPKLSSSLTFFQ